MLYITENNLDLTFLSTIFCNMISPDAESHEEQDGTSHFLQKQQWTTYDQFSTGVQVNRK